jgi:hypothetical protein
MFERLKKFHLILILSLFFLGTGYTLAFAITVDSKADAGSDYGQGAFARFVDASNPNITFGEVTTVTSPSQFSSAGQATAYATDLFPPGEAQLWWLLSAGNIWAATATDRIVGKSLSGLNAGTYRITPTGGAFTYDSWQWSPDYNLYLWKLNILADIDGQMVNYSPSILGSSTSYGSEVEAFNAVKGSYIDINLAEGGSLNFWIWDVNSVDNSGDLSFSVTAVPEPSTLLLLIMGLPVLVRRVRN